MNYDFENINFNIFLSDIFNQLGGSPLLYDSGAFLLTKTKLKLNPILSRENIFYFIFFSVYRYQNHPNQIVFIF